MLESEVVPVVALLPYEVNEYLLVAKVVNTDSSGATVVRFAFGVLAEPLWPAARADGTNAEPKRPASKLAVATAVANFFLIDIL
jgi:hypothetical protein